MYAPSTVGMTVYNLIAISGGALSGETLRERAMIAALPNMPVGEFDDGLQGLVTRGLVTQDASATDVVYDIADPARRIVGDRDRSDGDEVDDDGTMIGGWAGWMLKDPKLGLVPLEVSR